MNEEKIYKIDIDSIKKSFNFKLDGGLTHRPGVNLKLLPYTANDKDVVTDFSGVVGEFSRYICDKELENEFDAKSFIDNIGEEIEEYEGENSKEILNDIIENMFINDGNLINFDIKTLNYIYSSKGDGKIAKFLYSIFFSEELKTTIKKYYDKETKNVLYKLVLSVLPELKEKKARDEKYKCYIPFIKGLFKKDFEFLIKNEELYKNSLKRLLEYYYMFYVSQLAMKLSKFEKADLSKPESLYFTLSWERTSKNRTAYKFGWDKLKNDVSCLFSHAITLELLNHNGIEKQLGYNELFEIFSNMDEEVVKSELSELFDIYTNQITDKPWNQFKGSQRESGNAGFDQVYRIFDAVEHQFVKTSRTGAYTKYQKRFVDFVQLKFAKRRGALGYNLNITEEDIILMTKICINDNHKLKLNVLFQEFEKRGMFFDRDSRNKIIMLYEKLNLLEKKSDSGDAQYVKSVL